MRQRWMSLAGIGASSALIAGAVVLSVTPSAALAKRSEGARWRSRLGEARVHAFTSTSPLQVTNLTCTGAPQTYVVPAGVHSINVRIAGGDGGSGSTNVGGLAAFVSSAFAVTPGETLTVDVGCAGGTPAPSGTTGGAGGWGYGIGGAGGNATTAGAAGAGGGGASAVLRAATPLVISAGGGGAGAGSAGAGLGGDAETPGGNGAAAVTGGGGASSAGVGQAGAPGGTPGNGRAGGAGGAAGSSGQTGGGGGGAGFFGGGGGGVGSAASDGAGGGGGSSMVDPHSNEFAAGGTGDGSQSDGSVSISVLSPVTSAGYWQGWDIARGAAGAFDTSSNPLPGGYVVDGWGGVHPFGQGGLGAPPAPSGTRYWQGWDIVRGIATMPDGSGGFILDGWGGLHPFGLNGKNPPAVSTGPYWKGWDIARGVTILPDGSGGYVVDGWGGLHPFGVGAGAAPAVPAATPYWTGWDIVRGVSAPYWNGGTGPTGAGGYVVDGWGGTHPFGTVAAKPVTPPLGAPYWPGWPIARGVVSFAQGSGLVLDGFGGLHPFSSAGLPG